MITSIIFMPILGLRNEKQLIISVAVISEVPYLVKQDDIAIVHFAQKLAMTPISSRINANPQKLIQETLLQSK